MIFAIGLGSPDGPKRNGFGLRLNCIDDHVDCPSDVLGLVGRKVSRGAGGHHDAVYLCGRQFVFLHSHLARAAVFVGDQLYACRLHLSKRIPAGRGLVLLAQLILQRCKTSERFGGLIGERCRTRLGNCDVLEMRIRGFWKSGQRQRQSFADDGSKVDLSS